METWGAKVRRGDLDVPVRGERVGIRLEGKETEMSTKAKRISSITSLVYTASRPLSACTCS